MFRSVKPSRATAHRAVAFDGLESRLQPAINSFADCPLEPLEYRIMAGIAGFEPAVPVSKTGANIVTLRKAAGLTVADIQMVFGFNSPQAIYKWQNGTALPTVDNLIVLAALLNVRIDDILVVN